MTDELPPLPAPALPAIHGGYLGQASTSRRCRLEHSAYCSISCAPHRSTVPDCPSRSCGTCGHAVARFAGISVGSGDSGA